MNRLSIERRAAAIRSLVEGSSIRSVGRATGCDKDTVLRLLVEVGEFCSIYQHVALRNLPCKRIEADEIWSFVGAKAANAKQEGHGDIWTYTAICAESKLAVTWLVGDRSGVSTQAFMRDLAARLANRVQLSTDGLRWYESAVENAFGWNGVDYAQIRKVFGGVIDDVRGRGRYSPSPIVVEVEKVAIMGKPVQALVSTSYVERQNLNMRMQMRRFTRLTNAFSKKAENHAHAVSLHFMAYNFCKPHGTLTKRHRGIKTTPAMECGLTDRVWTWEQILERMEPTYAICN
jgi:IS1 family transposase